MSHHRTGYNKHFRLERTVISIVLLSVLLSACTSYVLAKRIVTAPNKSGMRAFGWDWDVVNHGPDAYRDTWFVEATNPPAKLAAAAIEPGNYSFHYDVRFGYPEGKPPDLKHFSAYWQTAQQMRPSVEPPKGTIVLLHGYMERKEYMVPWAIALAQAGYRCIVMDLRGHGTSSGDYISFGAFESHDVSLLLDSLAVRGYDVSHVGMLGISYGATVALLASGRDLRIQAVVAFQPFSSAGRAVPELLRAVFTNEVRHISDRQFAAAHSQQARIAGFEWSDADIPSALARARAPVLFFHGERDTWLSPDHSRALANVAPLGSELRIVNNDNHVSLRMQVSPFEQQVLTWFDAHIANGSPNGLSSAK
jgi:pimeloyl-ACP methyl ester carboxylesterase